MLMQFKYFSLSYLFVKEYHSLIRNRNCLPFAGFVHLFYFVLCYVFVFVCFRSVSCVPNVTSVSRLYILDCSVCCY